MLSQDELIKFGLSEKESKVYLTLLQLGEATVQELAESTEIKRPTVYLIVSTLLEQGLVAKGNRGKKVVFLAAHPRTLEELLKNKAEELKKTEALLGSLLPQLEALYTGGADRRPTIKLYEGISGQSALRSEAGGDQEADIYSFVALDDLIDAFPRYNTTHERSRIMRRTKSHVIYTRNNGPTSAEENDANLRESRFIPKDLFPFSGSLTVHPGVGKVYISTYRKYYVGIVIEDRGIAEMVYAIWKLAWLAAEGFNSSALIDPKLTQPSPTTN